MRINLHARALVRQQPNGSQPMYASQSNRTVSALASTAIVAGMAAMLLYGLQTGPVAQATQALVALDLLPPRPTPSPSPTPPPRKSEKSAPKGDPGRRNLKNEATQIVAVKPPVIILPPPPVVIATTPANTGNATQSGMSDRPGPGQGAGDFGDGMGGGGLGGDGDGMPRGSPPRRVRGRIAYDDLPDAIRAMSEPIELETDYVIETDGRVTNCKIVRSSGYRAVDALVCRIFEQRYWYRPARDDRGRPVRGHWVQNHFFIPEDGP